MNNENKTYLHFDRLTENYVPTKTKPIDWEARALEAEKKLQAFEWLTVCAADLVEVFPRITIKTIWKMAQSVNAVKDALEKL